MFFDFAPLLSIPLYHTFIGLINKALGKDDIKIIKDCCDDDDDDDDDDKVIDIDVTKKED